MEENDLLRIQDAIGGYEFKNKDLLEQAFVRRSYSVENGGQNNEVLEFVGDKVLDYFVIKLLVHKYSSFTEGEEFIEFKSELSEGDLTEIKRKLVEKSMLAKRIDDLDLSRYLIMGNGDIKENADTKASVKEDLFEAILGAVAIDSDWDNKTLTDTVEAMLEVDESLENDSEENYVELIQEWTQAKYNAVPWFHYDKFDVTYSWNQLPAKAIMLGDNLLFRQDDYKKNVICGLKLGEYEYSFWARGISKTDARKNVCKETYKYLKEHDMLLTIADEIENPNKEDSISQLEILARRGYFELPEYSFVQSHDKNGNPIWTCTCLLQEKNLKETSTSSSKKESKKCAAYNALTKILGRNTTK